MILHIKNRPVQNKVAITYTYISGCEQKKKVKKELDDTDTFSALERMQRMKKGSARLRVSRSLVREV